MKILNFAKYVEKSNDYLLYFKHIFCILKEKRKRSKGILGYLKIERKYLTFKNIEAAQNFANALTIIRSSMKTNINLFYSIKTIFVN